MNKNEVKAVVADLRFVLEHMTMHVATKDALARNIARLEEASR